MTDHLPLSGLPNVLPNSSQECVPLHDEGNPLTHSLGLSVRSDDFKKSLTREFECLVIGDIYNGFSGTTETASGVICPLGLSFLDTRTPMDNIRILGVVVKLNCKPSIAFVKIPHFFCDGRLSLSRSNLKLRKLSWVWTSSESLLPNRVPEQMSIALSTGPSKFAVIVYSNQSSRY